MRVGFVVAMEEEYAPFLSSLGSFVSEEIICGISFCVFSRNYREIVLAKSGIGCIAASAATSLLIGHFSCSFIANYGLVGALSSLPAASLVAVKDVVHYDADLTAFGAPLGAPADFDRPYFAADNRALSFLLGEGLPALRLASGDKFIADSTLKNRLISDFSADICDMEGAGIAVTSARAGVPFCMVKAVSDDAGENAALSFSERKGKRFNAAVSLLLSVFDKV